MFKTSKEEQCMSRLMFMLLICPTVAFAQGQLPNEVDLKAAYCIPIVRERVENPLNPEKYPESARKELQDLNGRNAINLRRLNLYLLPRLSQLEVASLVGAIKSAEEDLNRNKDEARQCKKMSSVEELWKCMETDTFKRLQSCNVVSFLPF
jgi:hypothetical protein